MDTSREFAGGGHGYGWLQPSRKPNWPPVESSSSSSGTSTPGTYLSTPSPYTNTSGGFTPQSSSSHGFNSLPGDAEDPRRKKLINCPFEELHLGNGDLASATSVLHLSGRWTWALTEIAGSIRNTFLADMLSVLEEQEQQELRPVHAHVQCARFAQESVSKMLPFVDGTVAAAAGEGLAPAPAEKLRALIAVREALSRASQDIQLSSCSTPSAEAKRITDEMACLLSSKQGEVDEAIWNTMEQTRTRLLMASTTDEDGASCSWWGAHQTPQGSAPFVCSGVAGINADGSSRVRSQLRLSRGTRGKRTDPSSSSIHIVTRAIVSYVNQLLSTSAATVAHQIVDEAAQLRRYVPRTDSVSPLSSLIMETASCLEEKLAETSRSFPDQSLRFLFLINNSYFVCHQLSPSPVLESHVANLARKIDSYIATCVQVSWAPVLSCLYIARPLCLGRYSSPAMFEAEFQKTYSAQKMWKVPDPKMRRRLRVAVVEKVVSSFTKYLECNYISPSRITPQDLMDMLQELFEG